MEPALLERNPAPSQSLVFIYHAAGNLVTKIENAPASGTTGARITSYSYDGPNQLLSIDLATDADWAFTYDPDAAKN